MAEPLIEIAVEDLVIKEVLHMPVGPNQVFPSKASARFALEVNQGWLERNHVSFGENQPGALKNNVDR